MNFMRVGPSSNSYQALKSTVKNGVLTYCSLVKLHCNFVTVYVLYIGIDNSSQGPTLT